MKLRREKELRCFCRGTPLLATYGVDENGKRFVHVKVYKQNRLYAELIFDAGVARIRCRNCLRWHRIIFTSQSVRLSEDQGVEARASMTGSAVVLDAHGTEG
jgi:hypothetical protein